MMKRWLLVLGAGVYQVPLIRAAQRLGFAVLVTSRRGPYPGIELADAFVPLDTTNVSGTVSVAREYKIAGVLTAGTDVAVPTVGAVVDALGLHGPCHEAAVTCSNKIKTKHALLRAGLPTAPFALARTPEEARRAAERISYPVAVKAPDSSGSRGVTRVDCAVDLERAWEFSTAVSRVPEILVERWLEGVEFGAQCVVVGSEPVLTLAHNDSVTPPPLCVPIGHSFPALLPADFEARVADVVARTIAAFGLTNTGVNFDFVWADGQPYVLEVGARIGATCLPELVSVHAGFNLYEALIQIALGDSPTVTPDRLQPTAAMLLRCRETGVVERVCIPDQFAADARIVECQIDVACGDRVQEFRTGPDRLGHVVVRGETVRQAETLAQQYAEAVIIEVA